MKWIVVTPPADRPVTWSELQDQMRVTSNEESNHGELLIEAAVDYAEEALATSLIERTLKATFYAGEILDLPRGPLIAITSIVDDSVTTITDYDVSQLGHTTRVTLNQSATYPIAITYTAGYAGAVVAAGFPHAPGIPASIRLAILCHAATLFENRESVADKAKLPVPHSLEAFYRLKSRSVGVG